METNESKISRFLRTAAEAEIWPTFTNDGFLIVESWDQHDDLERLLVKEFPNDEDLRELDDLFGYDKWGFDDEYTQCAHCYNVIRTSPDSYCWTPDFWLDEAEGEYVCGDCTREHFPDEYIEALVEKAAETGREVACTVLDPADHNFREVASNMEHGLHHDQADSPTSLTAWSLAHNFQPVFTIRTGQFDVNFDLWLRNDDGSPLSDEQLSEVKSALIREDVEYYGGRVVSYLRSEFREYPTPAQRCEAALKNIPPLTPGVTQIIHLEV